VSDRWPRGEWERRKASILEDVRILQAEVNEQRENVQMLKDRGHDSPARALEHHITRAEILIKEVVEGFEEVEEGEDYYA